MVVDLVLKRALTKCGSGKPCPGLCCLSNLTYGTLNGVGGVRTRQKWMLETTFTAMDRIWIISLACFVTLLSRCIFANEEKGVKLKPVTAALHTQWAQTPLIMEAAEFFYDENPGMFWSFVDRLRDIVGTKSITWTDKEQHDVALSIGLQLLSPVKQNFLTFAMALRYYSPRIEMYRQILLSEVSKTKPCGEVLVDFGGGLISCGLKEFTDALQSFDSSKSLDRKNPEVISLDHLYPGSSSSSATVMVYGNLLSPDFYQVHELIMSRNTDFRFVFRHHLDASPTSHYSKVRIPGYGVELAIKSTEYKAQDDRKIKEGEAGDQEKPEDNTVDDELDTDIEGFDFGKLKSRFPQKKDQLEQMKSFLLQSTGTELQQLKAWQFQDLSLQAAEKALKVAALHTGSATDALRTVRDISQNFPTQAPTLLRVPVQDLVKGEIERNREYFTHYHNLEHGAAALFINGIQYDTDLLDTFALFDKLREENRLMESLHGFGIRGSDLSAILELDLRPTESAKYGVDIRHPAVVWINDLEKDKRYADWPSSPRELIRQSFPPTLLKPIRRNFYNLILVVNPANISDSRDILKLAESFYVHRLPIRMGIIFVTNPVTEIDGTNDASVAMFNSFKHITEQKSGATALSFLTDLYTKAVKDGQLAAEEVIKYFKLKYPQENTDVVFGPESAYNSGRNDGRQFIEKLNIGEPPLVLLNGVQLDRTKLTADEFENEVLQNLVGVYSVLQRDVMSGQLTDHSNVIEYLMAKPHIVPRLNSLILDPPEFRFLEFGGKSLDPEKYTFANFEAMKAEDRTATMVATSFYMVKHEEEEAHPVTIWVVADAETPAGRELMYNVVKHSKTSKNVRVSFVFNPSKTDSMEKGVQLTKAIQVALETQSMNLARNFITKLLKEENVSEIAAGTKTWEDFEVNGMDMKAFTSGLKELSSDFLKIHSLFVREELNLKPGENVLIANGYIVGPVKNDFGMDDIALLEKYIESYGATKLSNELHRLGIFRTADQLSDAVMMTSTLLSGLGSQEEAKKRKKVQYSEMSHSVINIEQRDSDSPSFDITFIVDPVSREAQKIIPVLMVLHEALNCRVRVFFNCKDKLSELPLRSFYRMVLEAKLTFTENGSIAPNYALARFPALPQTALLTMNLQAPDNWLTEATSAVYDLDNIRLTELVDGWGIHGGFELVNLLLEGSAKDAATDQPPRGTQFVLGTRNQPERMDTIVMANLGYFQLKANPGSWILKLREGRSHEIYSIASAEGTEKEGSDEEQQRVVIGSFNTKMMKIYVKKRPGMEREDVLSEKKDATETEAGIFNSISSYWSKDEHKSAAASDDVINIFSLASGHLYERFLRIMMLSVVKNTKTPVKFWLLRNYLSPQFKEIIPYIAEHYGFEYELVEYKWPRWLNQQSEKQRIIWGYKILFLDVLFPLSVKKIIFVDADQIVRTDLKELREFDLEGAPYGYTPFCESRQDMDGFRFWKNGYWASHLGNRKYHISALYVVDLARFRKIAAGDRLRAQYQGLSQDPNSLSNLDQDLPNNMIYQVPIKSLPQEWLWCETWCDEASKAKAKTIDLCNNPLTKEPKLASAMRIVPEWNTYDQEIKILMDEFYGAKSLTEENPGEPVLREATLEDTLGGDDSDNEILVHSTEHTHQHGDEL